ncbi:hypothetical protein AVEN_10543-1 [Araneus ventricosus]|uniref:Uncharacterized protein n=1 Tax=Araneus ventricosus TaxID=182803 RepID=A0A4Y2G4H8_ARAVE|nr:hypothetical protein AVEN_10543-1 [Araneus ventricosus]
MGQKALSNELNDAVRQRRIFFCKCTRYGRLQEYTATYSGGMLGPLVQLLGAARSFLPAQHATFPFMISDQIFTNKIDKLPKATESDHLVQSTYPETCHSEIDGQLRTTEIVPHPVGIQVAGVPIVAQ